MPVTPRLKIPSPSRERKSLLGGTSSAKPAQSRSPSIHPLFDPSLENFYKPRIGPDRILLRVDAFLGEWLSPDYYEDITPPPNSTMMVAGAKADLLRRGDHIQEMASATSSKGHFPGGWARKDAPSNNKGQSTENKTTMATSSLAQAAPFRERSSSHGSALTLERTRSREAIASMAPPTPPVPGRAYEPPAPSYSVSPSDPIPRGYVAHAQDACIQVDFQWDSMRPPQDWGDGGEFGDEWSTMHKRFRRGISGMMEWYRIHGAEPPKDPVPGFMFKVLSNKPPPPIRKPSEAFPAFGGDADVDDDEELILIIITHGAGCNALLGAISNQPVLIDVGLAALSMAIRRDEPRKPSAPTIHERRLSVADPGMSDTYEMKILASVDHLRPGVDPSQLSSRSQSQTQSPAVAQSPSLDARRRFTGSPAANSPTESPFSMIDPRRSWNSSLGSVRRTASSGSSSRYTSLSTASAAVSPGGLWSGTRTPVAEASSDRSVSPGANVVTSLSNAQPKPKPAATLASLPAVDGPAEPPNPLTKLDSKEERETGDTVAPLVTPRGRTASTAASGLWGAKTQPKAAQGLWGPPRLDDVYEHGRGPKRRWTVTEREDSM